MRQQTFDLTVVVLIVKLFVGTSSAQLEPLIMETMETEHIPGLAACIVKDGEIIWTGAYGHANIEHDREVADTTVFVLASVSKTVTGTALMQLWEDGSFELDDSINGYLPFEVVNPHFPDSAITFRMLMTHTSGLKDNWAILDSLANWNGDPLVPLDEFLMNYFLPDGEYYDENENFNLWPPGSDSDYSVTATALAGYVVEAISEIPFDQHCEEHVFAPLEMNETSWFYADLDTSNIAMPYHWDGSTYVPYGLWSYVHYPGGMLKTSSLQLARFLTAFMQGGQLGEVTIVDSSTVELMTTVEVENLFPNIDFPNIDCGLFWLKLNLYGRTIWGHYGSIFGVRTVMFFCPDENSGAIVLTNGESLAIWLILDELLDFAEDYVSVDETEDDTAKPELYQDTPNPFNPTTAIGFSLPEAAHVSLRIYDIQGQLVKTLMDEEMESGYHSINWNGEDADNRNVSSGVYLSRIMTNKERATNRMILLR